MRRANKITRANAGGPPRRVFRGLLAARIAQFRFGPKDMRALSYLLAFGCWTLVAGCTSSQARRRAEYVRATLPHDATLVLSAAVMLRQENPNSKALGFLDEALRVDLLRLQVCLSDPGVTEKDKKFDRS